jgi:hypothetical protein
MVVITRLQAKKLGKTSSGLLMLQVVPFNNSFNVHNTISDDTIKSNVSYPISDMNIFFTSITPIVHEIIRFIVCQI